MDNNIFPNVKLLNKDDIFKIFECLNQKLKENQLQLELTVYGGALMSMVYDNRPATRDIDCVFDKANLKLLKYILDDIKEIFNLSDDWINDDIKEPLRYLIEERKVLYKQYSNLKILRPNPEQLLAMKILSARPEPAKDFVDSYLLCKDLKIDTKEKLMNVVKKFIPLSLLGERQLQFVKYLGEDLGYDWK